MGYNTIMLFRVVGMVRMAPLGLIHPSEPFPRAAPNTFIWNLFFWSFREFFVLGLLLHFLSTKIHEVWGDSMLTSFL